MIWSIVTGAPSAEFRAEDAVGPARRGGEQVSDLVSDCLDSVSPVP